MKNMEFDNCINYTKDLIALFPKAMEKRLDLDLCGLISTKISRPTIEMLMHSASVIEIDGETVDTLCERLDDPNYKISEAAAVETVRRLRAMNSLTRAEVESRIQEGSAEVLADILVRSILQSDDREMSDCLVLSEMMLEVFDYWSDAEMGDFGRAMGLLLQTGLYSAESVMDSLEEKEENSALDEDDLMLVGHAGELVDEFYDRIGMFLVRYPDMEDCFQDDAAE